VTAPVVTAVYVGSGLAVHALAGRYTREQLASGEWVDTLCGARRAGQARHRRGRAPAVTLASAGYGITCGTCARRLPRG
jgi:hypothetical protein